MSITIKRVYDEPDETDGFRVLVDRLWPRGLTKDKIKIDLWLKEISPSNELRKWAHKHPEKCAEFKEKYFAELRDHDSEVKELIDKSKNVSVTLVYASKNIENNNASALRDYLLSIS
ncbi:MAG: DUF488 domain-containing protein [Calditrichaceae bacterium]